MAPTGFYMTKKPDTEVEKGRRSKRPYVKPALVHYGDVREFTRGGSQSTPEGETGLPP